MERKVTWFDDPAEAEKELSQYHADQTPNERLAAYADLLNRYGGWSERRLERVATIITVPRR